MEASAVKVIGVGMVEFAKPGAHEPYEVMAAKAIRWGRPGWPSVRSWSASCGAKPGSAR